MMRRLTHIGGGRISSVLARSRRRRAGSGREVALVEEDAARLVGLVDAPVHGLHPAVRHEPVVALQRPAARQDVQRRRLRAVSRGRARTGGGARSRTRRAPSPTADVGATSGVSMRPTCSTKIVRAPAASARSMGIELTTPPSMKCSSPMRVAGSSPGTEADARIAGMSGPESNTCSAARSMLAATTRSGTARSSNRMSVTQRALEDAPQRRRRIEVRLASSRAARAA